MELESSDSSNDIQDIPQQQKQQQQQQEQEQEQEQDQIQKKQQEQEEQGHFHVLAVDDSVIDRKLLEKLLKVSSYQVTCVDSGDKALEYLGLPNNLDCASKLPPSSSSSSSSSCFHTSQQAEGLKVNLIMTDFCMPGMSGYDLLKRVKGSSWKDVPVVVMSSENVPSRISMCLEGGAEEFLLKPLRLSDLDKIEAYLLKSLHSCTIIDKDHLINDGDDDDDDNNNDVNNDDDNNSNDDNNNNNNESSSSNNNNNNNNFSKRKAISSEATESERRPKMKGVALVV